MKPLIGILAHPNTTEIRGKPSFIQSVGENYLHSLEEAGALPLILPIYDEPEALDRYVRLCDGFLIPGGLDVNPMFYGEDPSPLLGMCRQDYDLFELHLISLLREAKKPVLAICRGLQILNVAYGGTLYQDLSLFPGAMEHLQQEDMPGGVSHKITIEEGSMLHRLFGVELWVNSFHHQAVKELGQGLKITARAYDGVVEALEATDMPYLHAVQWHPEIFWLRKDNTMLPLLKDFVEACQR